MGSKKAGIAAHGKREISVGASKVNVKTRLDEEYVLAGVATRQTSVGGVMQAAGGEMAGGKSVER